MEYKYDALDRFTSKTAPDSTAVGYTYDLASRLTKVSDSTGVYGFVFDNDGKLTGTTTQYAFLANQAFTNSYGYDAASNRTSFTGPDGSTNTYAYDILGRLTDITNPWAGHFGFGYDTLSRRTQMTRPNGVATGYNYDNLSRLLSVLHGTGPNPPDGAGYGYDNAGNRSSKKNLQTGVDETYGYDALYQLKQVTQTVNGTANTSEQYSYDGAGNRQSGLGVSLLNYNSSNQLTSTPTTSFTYDANGNMLTKADPSGTAQFTWDFENRLTQVTKADGTAVTFKYDPFGRRIQKASSESATNYVYDGANIVAEYDSTGAVIAKYAQGAGIDEPLAMQRGGQTAFYHADGLGSITSLTDASGAALATYTYDSFGNTTSSGGIFNPFQYTGRENDSETGLYYYRARYYDPYTGRFLSEDPAKSGNNFYSYVRNNPIVRTDPFGLWDTYTHHALLWNALRGCGVSKSDIWQLQQASDFVDAFMATDSAKHAMRDPGQNPADAMANTDKWIQDNLNDAMQMYQQYGDTTSASNPTGNYTTPLGNALHTIMDSTSPLHRRNGIPLPFPGGNALHHGGPSNPFGSGESWDYMTRELMQQNTVMIRRAYEQVTGHKCGCEQ